MNSESRIWQLTSSAILQATGSFATLLTIAYLAHVFGPLEQGTFSALKAEFDFFSALCLLGLAQAIFYFAVSEKLLLRQAVTITFVHGALAFLVVGLWATFFLRGEAIYFQSRLDTWVFASAVAAGVIYINGRALVLAVRSTFVFSITTALPSFLLFAIVVIGSMYAAAAVEPRSVIANPIMFLLAYAVAAIAALVMSIPKGRMRFETISISETVELVKFGFANWLPAIAQTGSTLFAFRWMSQALALSKELGAFSTALALLLAAIVPLNMVVPIFFKWWAPMLSEKRHSELLKVSFWVFVLGCTGIVTIWIFESFIVNLLFGSEYLEFLGLYSLMSLAIIPQAAMRIWGVYSSSSGRPGVAAWFEILRFSLLVGAIILYGKDLNSMVIAWVCVEYTILVLSSAYFFNRAKV